MVPDSIPFPVRKKTLLPSNAGPWPAIQIPAAMLAPWVVWNEVEELKLLASKAVIQPRQILPLTSMSAYEPNAT